MFKKLRMQFLLLIMGIITIVMTISFMIVYTITRQNIIVENHVRLNEIIGEYMSHGFEDDGLSFIWGQHYIPTSFDTYIFIRIDENHQIIQMNTGAPFDLEFYESLIQDFLNEDTTDGIAQLEQRQWLFQIQNVGNERIFAFLDITDRMTILHNLSITFAMIGVSMLVVIFFISFVFSKHIIKPIESSWQQQKQFIADASHELKTPLAIISANLSAMKVKPKDFEKFSTYIDIQVSRMAGLINHLLTLAKHDTLTIKGEQQRINLSAVVESIGLGMEVLAYEKGLAITSVIEPNQYILADQEKINQVMTILFDNAIKYAKTESKSIAVSLKSQMKVVSFEISNTIDKMEPLDPEKLFDRFYRADEARVHEEGGYGLGLAIAKVIIDELGGQILAKVLEDQIIFTVMLKQIK